jgi:hypothetical protein
LKIMITRGTKGEKVAKCKAKIVPRARSKETRWGWGWGTIDFIITREIFFNFRKGFHRSIVGSKHCHLTRCPHSTTTSSRQRKIKHWRIAGTDDPRTSNFQFGKKWGTGLCHVVRKITHRSPRLTIQRRRQATQCSKFPEVKIHLTPNGEDGRRRRRDHQCGSIRKETIRT